MSRRARPTLLASCPSRLTEASGEPTRFTCLTRPDEKLAHLREAVEVFAGLGLKIPQIRALIDLADVLIEAGDDPAETLEEARSIAASCGAGLYLDQIERRAGSSAG